MQHYRRMSKSVMCVPPGRVPISAPDEVAGGNLLAPTAVWDDVGCVLAIGAGCLACGYGHNSHQTMAPSSQHTVQLQP